MAQHTHFAHAYMINSPPPGKEGWAGVTPEPNLLPIFYYNDILARPGESIGLNLFEPRYCEMCKRIVEKRVPQEFLFVPNYEDYQVKGICVQRCFRAFFILTVSYPFRCAVCDHFLSFHAGTAR